jgi:nucleoside 2-deoxyribosyltransferase
MTDRVLRQHDIVPIRVDRIEHNDDIDKRILAELYSCDLALADLTYARPSVYFEAGFAQRKVPVIYTCRRDHFTPRANDPEGNLKVHFDLQMRNIVTWQDPQDRAFKDRLTQRIAHVIAPLLSKKEIEEQAQEDARRFAALSTEEKTKRVLGLCVSQLRRAKFFLIPKSMLRWHLGSRMRLGLASESIKLRTFREFMGSDHTWLGIRKHRSQIEFALVLVVPTLTKGTVSNLKEFILSRPIYQINLSESRTVPAELVEHIFICSVKRVSDFTVMNNLPNFHRDSELNALIWSGKHLIETGSIPKRREKQIPRVVYIHILDKIQSESQFKTAMSDQVSRL